MNYYFLIIYTTQNETCHRENGLDFEKIDSYSAENLLSNDTKYVVNG